MPERQRPLRPLTHFVQWGILSTMARPALQHSIGPHAMGTRDVFASPVRVVLWGSGVQRIRCRNCYGKRPVLTAAFSSLVLRSLMLLAWGLAQQCPRRAKAPRLGARKDASGHFPQYFATPHAARGERHANHAQ